jgi:predicted permease
MNDIRTAWRTLRRDRGFAAVGVLTLAFGIGVNVTVFGLISAFFLQPLPVKDPHQLVLLMQRGDVVNFPHGHSFPDYLDYRASATVFSELAAYTPTPAHISARGQAPERTWIEVVSPSYFSVAGVTPAFGEFPPPESEFVGGPPTVVLAYRYWQRRFGGDPSLVGRPITLNGKSFTVVGIAPASFTGLSWAMAVSGFVPSGSLGALQGSDGWLRNRGTPAWRVMGRLGSGKTIEDARAEVSVIAARLAAVYPAEHKGTRPLVIPENRARPDPAIAGFLPIFAAVFAAMVGLVLAIACANVANLMLSRAITRQRDLVIRSAIGASRMRLIRLQLAESLMLAAAAGICALVLSHWAGGALAGFTPTDDIPINEDRPWDWRVYVFTAGASAIAGVAAGLWPALRAMSFDLVTSLKEGGSSIGKPKHALRNLLVIGQVTLSLVVLSSAGMFLHSLRQMRHLDLGLRADGLMMASVDLGLQQYGDQRGLQFLQDLLTKVRSLPGVTAATVSVHVPFDYGMQFTDVSIDGPVPGTKDETLSTGYNAVGSGFFETMPVRVVRGRGLYPSLEETTQRVAVVNETMARKLWPSQDPVGRRFRIGQNGDWIDVVGVAADGKYMMLAEEPRAYFYVPLSQRYSSPVTVIVRSASDPAALLGPLQRLLRELDADLPVFNIRTMERHVRDSVFGLMPIRMAASMAAVQGAIGLLLAVMGLYAVVSYAVARRTREIGIRMALGAQRTDVVRLVVGEGLRLSVVGVVLGVIVSAALGLGLSKVLYGVGSVEVRVLGAVTILLLAVSGVACYLPARVATRVDPLSALRHE